MNNEDNNLDLLDLDDAESVDTLPEVPVFAAPRPKKPWLLLSLGVVIIVLASYIIIRSIGGESSSSIEVDLDAPVMVVDGAGTPVDMNVMPPAKTTVKPHPEQKPVEQPAVAESAEHTVHTATEYRKSTASPATADSAEYRCHNWHLPILRQKDKTNQ